MCAVSGSKLEVELRGTQAVLVCREHLRSANLHQVKTGTQCLHLIAVINISNNLIPCSSRGDLEASPHLASPLQHILHHVLSPGPHLVAVTHEKLAEACPVDHIRVEMRCHQKICHAVCEVIHNYSVQVV